MTGRTGTLELGARIRAGLAGLRTRARLALAAYGVSSVIVYAVFAGLISFGLDRSLRLAWGTRATAWVLAVTVLLVVLWRRLVQPLKTRLSDSELARRVEAWHPALQWRLLSAVQFADPSWEAGPETSSELAGRVVADAEELAKDVSFGAPVPIAPVLRASTRGGLVLVAAVALVLGFPEGARIWFQRNVLLMANVSWPRDTQLEVLELTANGAPVAPSADGEGGTVYTVARGATLGVVVQARGVVPTRVYLDSSPSSGEGAGELLTLDALEGGRFRTSIERVAVGFRFSLEGGDGLSGPFHVEVLHRPWIERLRLEIEPPAYTGLQARSFPLESSNVAVPVGTAIRLAAEVSKPLAHAELVELAAGEEGTLSVAGVHTGVLVSEPAPGFSAALRVERSALFGIRVTDSDGLGFERPTRFTVVATPDLPPTVRLELSGVGLNVTPQAKIRFAVSAEDDYGVAGRSLRYTAKLGGEDEPLSGEQVLPPAAELGVEESFVLDLSTLALKPKMALTLWGQAVDTDPQGPNTGGSPGMQLRVVTPEELLNELLRRIHEQRLELERMIGQEEQLAQGLSGADLKTLERAPSAQRDVGRTVGRAAGAVEQVVQELESNDLLDAATQGRLREQVSQPLLALEEGSLATATDLAEAALETEGAKRTLAMGLAGEAAKGVAAELRAIVDRMGRIEELAELVSLLKRVINGQRKLMRETQKRQAERRGGD